MFPTELVALNFAVDEYASDRGVFPSRKRESRQVIYVATMEKAHGVNFLTEEGRLSEIGTQYLFYFISSCFSIAHCKTRIGGGGRNPHNW